MLRLASFSSMIGPENTHHLLANQMQLKTNATWSRVFSRASSRLLVSTLSFHWFLVIFLLIWSAVVITLVLVHNIQSKWALKLKFSSSKTCGLTAEQERCLWTSPFTMPTSICSASLSKLFLPLKVFNPFSPMSDLDSNSLIYYLASRLWKAKKYPLERRCYLDTR